MACQLIDDFRLVEFLINLIHAPPSLILRNLAPLVERQREIVTEENIFIYIKQIIINIDKKNPEKVTRQFSC